MHLRSRLTACPFPRPFLVVALLAMGAVIPLACAPAGDEPGGVASTPEAPPAGVVDSIFPIEEEIRRFRVDLPEVTEFAGGAATRDALVDRFIQVVESGELEALTPLLLTRSEFGYLYYPHTMYTAKPYELSPALLWFQMENLTSRSLTRLSRRLAGNPIHASGYTCEEPSTAEGANRVWNECRVRLSPPGEDPYEIRLFGSIVERDGIFKFVSYSSEL